MSSERPNETNRVRKLAESFKGKLSSLLHRRLRVQALITLQGEHLNSFFLRHFIEQFRTFKSFATRPCGW